MEAGHGGRDLASKGRPHGWRGREGREGEARGRGSAAAAKAAGGIRRIDRTKKRLHSTGSGGGGGERGREGGKATRQSPGLRLRPNGSPRRASASPAKCTGRWAEAQYAAVQAPGTKEQAGKGQGGRADLAAQAASRAERQGAQPMWHVGSANTVPYRPGPPSLSKVKQVVARRADSPLYSQGGATPLCRRQPTLHSREPQHRCRASRLHARGGKRGGGREEGRGRRDWTGCRQVRPEGQPAAAARCLCSQAAAGADLTSLHHDAHAEPTSRGPHRPARSPRAGPPGRQEAAAL